VKGPVSGRGISLTGHAPGRVIWPLHRVVIERMAGNLRMLRAAGKALKPEAHHFADRLLHTALKSWREGSSSISVPPNLLSEVVLLLLALPGPKRGRPRKPSTGRALELSTQYSVREAARLIAKSTGENPENIRARVLGAKRRIRKGGNKFK
jgi:hypothetical protein